MHRLFVALRPPAAIRDRLLATMAGVPGARWQDDAQLHLTLRFVGEVERPVAEDIADALDRVYAPIVTARLAGVGRFERRGCVDTLWAGVAPRDPLAALARSIDAAVTRAGVAPDRRAYHPHVTIARLRASDGVVAPWLAEHAALSSEAFAMDRIVLYESRLGHAGAAYEAVSTVRLR